MVRRIVIRKAELLAGEPVIEVFRINQSNLRAALRFGTVFAVLMALRFLPDSPLVVQWAAALAVSYLVFVLLDPGAYIAFTATGAVLMASGRFLPRPVRVVRPISTDDVAFGKNIYGEWMQINGIAVTGDRDGMRRMLAAMADRSPVRAS
ncbi:MAG: hypothetical protein KAY11_02310 [Ilumatobacteraceae bacterium]|nr:hypothetical protein [Ilumatobacteraceae bacterium]MBP8208372.1 hypothetical protein [Ilumatobacteraceae bacterium]